jgi:hypothetical protein
MDGWMDKWMDKWMDGWMDADDERCVARNTLSNKKHWNNKY